MGNIEREGNTSDGDLGASPGGALPGGEEATASQGENNGDSNDSESITEPGFDDSGEGAYAGGGLPDLSDEPSLEDAMESFEDAMGETGEPGSSAGAPGGIADASGTPPGGMEPGDSGNSGAGGVAGSAGERAGRSAAGATPGLPTGSYGTAAGTGPLTPAEQVAILDAQLERGAGEFDAMILEEQARQRRSTREKAGTQTSSQQSSSENNSAYEGGVADAGGYSSGGGMGGATRGGGVSVPQNTAKYPAPADIPSGNDDDVVARQLREAAMREPDPAIREKLWDEYRKYKGLD